MVQYANHDFICSEHHYIVAIVTILLIWNIIVFFDGYVDLPVLPHVEIMRDVVMATL